ncbi:hypothetical protein [Gordonia sp. (in: high G+C Gram-positive bacteria)]|uniref:hypothetical protein n=1 Tax=unclassified Gordonia (in: high G+C Gram-positive bacteria) TaxID=2657482 RepID=UPI002611B6E9|nr:hypothetical protein [Gordonia sp. (in: high G+C Gram-positive bacteria)]
MASHAISPPPPGAEAAALSRAVAAAIADPGVSRLIVTPPADSAAADLFLSQVVGVLMRHERLDVEVAYVPAAATRATRVYGLPHGGAAAKLAESGAAHSLPLIRDDAATVLVGRARHLGAAPDPGSGRVKLHGETYVDSERLFDGDVRGVVIEPLTEAPGVRARLDRLIPGGWLTGRAVQTGGTNLVVEREGELSPRPVKRSTFYRHHIDWKLVRP